jgi:hypothetical protein
VSYHACLPDGRSKIDIGLASSACNFLCNVYIKYGGHLICVSNGDFGGGKGRCGGGGKGEKEKKKKKGGTFTCDSLINANPMRTG